MTSTDVVDVSGHGEPRFAEVRRVFAQHLQEGSDVGASVAVTVDGQLVVDLWGGWANAARTRAWEADTIVNVWSTTKGITALAIHMLVDRGLLDLDEPIARYWPKFAANGKEDLLVRWALTHQAGLPTVDVDLPAGAALDWEFMTTALAAQRPYWEPGTKMGYHGVTFGWLLGELVRRVAGVSLRDFVRDEISIPLGVDFQIGCSVEDESRCADVLYPPGLNSAKPTGVHPAFDDPMSLNYRSTELLITPPVNAEPNTRAWREAEFGAMNGHSNARAVATIYGALARGGGPGAVQLLRQETLDRAISLAFDGYDDQIMMLPFKVRRALGFTLPTPESGDPRGPRAFGHSGAGGSLGFADPDRGLGFAYIMNQMAAYDLQRPDRRAMDLAAAVYSALSPSASKL